MTVGTVVVTPELRIPRDELVYRATRAGGPGGQHVNKSSTRIEIVWNVQRSRAIDDEQRALIVQKLAPRIDREGHLRVVASAHRSQTRNRGDAEERLARLVRHALTRQKARRPTKPTRSAVEERLRRKQARSAKKAARRARDFD